MSMELYVFLNKCDMPIPEAWQQSINAASFDLRVDTDFDPFHFTGFLPCELRDRSTGFEYYFSPSIEVAPPETYLAPMTSNFDSVVTFIWGGDLQETVAVMMAAGALAASVDSLLHFADDDSSVRSAQALPYARQQIAAADRFLKT